MKKPLRYQGSFCGNETTCSASNFNLSRKCHLELDIGSIVLQTEERAKARTSQVRDLNALGAWLDSVQVVCRVSGLKRGGE